MDGTSDGVMLGMLNDGASLGTIDGESVVGSGVTGAGVVGTVGTSIVGESDGFADGSEDGLLELVGTMDGISLGASLIVGAVGLLEGVPVGAVGSADGLADGS